MQLHSFVASFYILFHIFYLYLCMVCLLFFFSKPSPFIICITSSNHSSESWMQELFFPICSWTWRWAWLAARGVGQAETPEAELSRSCILFHHAHIFPINQQGSSYVWYLYSTLIVFHPCSLHYYMYCTNFDVEIETAFAFFDMSKEWISIICQCDVSNSVFLVWCSRHTFDDLY